MCAVETIIALFITRGIVFIVITIQLHLLSHAQLYKSLGKQDNELWFSVYKALEAFSLQRVACMRVMNRRQISMLEKKPFFCICSTEVLYITTPDIFFKNTSYISHLVMHIFRYL